MKILLLSLALISAHLIYGQTSEAFDVGIKEINLDGIPGLQSFVQTHHNGKWLLIGGRTDGLHQRQPFAAFNPDDNNTVAYVIDPESEEVFSASLSALDASMYDQLQSTNMQFEKRDSTLYIIGGYGYSSAEADHHTYPNLCAVNVSGLINAIISEASITPYFRQITDNRLQVTGGYLDRINDRFYLAGGQQFEGRYNPHGPNHGPGFFQKYTDAIKRFEILDDGTNLSIEGYVKWVDSANLHRRDYNMAPQNFPNGQKGFTMFSGVFQPVTDLPWLNTVNVFDTGYAVVNDFNQYLNQYHSAHLPIWDDENEAMHTTFFGGISRYTLDENDQLVDDTDVPFVNTISQVVRYSDLSMEELKIGEMPALLGSGAEFIPIEHDQWFDERHILLLQNLPFEKVLVGHIVGGIESSAPNIFFSNTGSQSEATTRVFEVYVTRGATAGAQPMDGSAYFKTRLYPNPTKGQTQLEFNTPDHATVLVSLYDLQGMLIKTVYTGTDQAGTLTIDTRDLAAGTYVLRLSTPQFQKELKLSVASD